ncbi:MAG: hypothetical protein GC160_13210 [Acidobacteria bacterium]|nr:hypothetical protein [Acidobacteriota bacterium]
MARPTESPAEENDAAIWKSGPVGVVFLTLSGLAGGLGVLVSADPLQVVLVGALGQLAVFALALRYWPSERPAPREHSQAARLLDDDSAGAAVKLGVALPLACGAIFAASTWIPVGGLSSFSPAGPGAHSAAPVFAGALRGNARTPGRTGALRENQR